MKKIILSLVVVFIFLFSPQITNKTWAEEAFSTQYDLTYEVDGSGLTTVIYRIGVTNLTTRFFASEYDLTVPSTKIQSFSASDRRGKISPKVETLESSTKIHLEFNDQVVGKGSTLNFNLSYQTPEIAQKNGRIWEVNLPPKTENPQISAYNVHLKVPKTFGKPAYLSPRPESGLNWTKDEMKGGVAAAFGDYQLFSFDLSYHLLNPKFFPVYMEITLPSDTAYQKIRFGEIRPQPVSVRQDEDGNWLARYNLSSGEKINIIASGWVKIMSSPTFDHSVENKNLNRYLLEQKYWETSDSQVQKLASELKTPRAIYDYVVSTLKYNYQKAKSGGKRIGAKKALQEPKNAICMEFTDLFIALARAASIPAREVDGFAYTTNSKLRPISLEKDILHAWPEFWDKERQAWVMVDPTWGETTGGIDYFEKLDFNHFALSVKGLSSELPLPAGAFILNGKSGKNVKVEFALKDWEDEKGEYNIIWDFPKWAMTGFGFDAGIDIKNTGHSAVWDEKISFSSTPPGLLKDGPINLSLVPGESRKISLQFNNKGLFDGFNGTISMVLNGQTFSHPFQLNSLGWLALSVLITIVMTIAILIFFKRYRRKINSHQNEAKQDKPAA